MEFVDNNVVITSLYLLSLILTTNCVHHVSQRAIVFPNPTLLQFVFAISVPGTLEKRSFQISAGFQANFELATNVTQYHTPTLSKRSITKYDDEVFDRSTFYLYVEQFLESLELNGRDCLLKSICDLARVPFNEDDDNLLERLIYFILTPSLSKTQLKYSNDSMSDVYLQAENIGKQTKDCELVYLDCSFSFVEYFTRKIFI